MYGIVYSFYFTDSMIQLIQVTKTTSEAARDSSKLIVPTVLIFSGALWITIHFKYFSAPIKILETLTLKYAIKLAKREVMGKVIIDEE